MKRWGLFLLRVTTGWLLVMWGLDKLVNVEHGQAVAEAFYLGIGTQAAVLNVLGVLQIILGALVVLGLWRKRAYPVAFVILLITALGVWRSIIDPWGWVLEGSQVLFYPSAIIAAGALLLWGTIDEDEMTLDAKMGASG
ncbi:MAG: DoxX family membrane protein [Gemmatimonadota bacterium]|nr:DoxX family membrane protein [Gemmatimonadota bacterium]